MRTLILYGIVTLFGSFAFSQNKSLEVLYSIKIKSLDAQKLSSSAERLALALEKRAFKLQINGTESLFSSHETLTNNETLDDKLAKITLETNNVYYINNSEKVCLKKVPTLGTIFVIETPIKNDWNITKEKKKIGNYMCYKATKKTTKVSHKSGKFELNVEAWYCPELSMPFGPLNYNGLPGLILELHLNKIIYYANSIKTKQIHIKRPQATNTISQNDFDILMKDTYNNRGN